MCGSLGKERESHGSEFLGFRDWSFTVSAVSLVPKVSEASETITLGAHTLGFLD